jgi:5-methyltetrahydrofolate--homocysteine methyltransferase
VKGDVHDIGKNIVGVVLACNNYEVIDLGVMVSCEKILETARKEKVDIIGLSGLITPSLDEMVYVAQEMERQGFTIPLLIGGATTSKVHTAVRIAPCYSNTVVHVNDASKSVTVAGSLLSKDNKDGFENEVREAQQKLRDHYERGENKEKYISISEARRNKLSVDWDRVIIRKPSFLGNKVFEDHPIEELVPFIDWTPFFHTWELKGSYPKIFNDKDRGAEAKKLFDDAQEMLKRIIEEKWIRANAVVGFYPANSNDNDDILIYADEESKEVSTVIYALRQQTLKPKGHFNLSLSDFVAPCNTNKIDYVGGFAVTAGLGIEEHLERFKTDHDDYSSIMLKALADRLAEAFAEYMHLKVRKELWGYAAAESLTREDLIKEVYQGIRPAQGYPACPDHTIKQLQFRLLDAEKNAGITLTESMAMYPAASVSGMYFYHPFSQYFGLGKIAKDQVEDYAKRRQMDLKLIERWLSPNLAY